MLLIEWMWYSNLQKANSGEKNMCKERKWCLQEITNEVSDVNKLERKLLRFLSKTVISLGRWDKALVCA